LALPRTSWTAKIRACIRHPSDRQADLATAAAGIAEHGYPGRDLPEQVEFDSMINLRPSQKNRSRSVDDPAIRQKILDIVQRLVA
jgi:hypothetical protein